MEDDVCIICKKGDNLIKVKEKALNLLIESSKKRRDFKFKKMQSMTSAFIHDSCKRVYNDFNSISVSNKVTEKKKATDKQIIKDARDFDFENLCFFCGKLCDKHRESVHMLTKEETRRNLIAVVERGKVSSDSCKFVIARLKNVPDLIQLKPNYHSSCMSKFYSDHPTAENVGRPASKSTKDFLQYVIDHIKSNKK